MVSLYCHPTHRGVAGSEIAHGVLPQVHPDSILEGVGDEKTAVRFSVDSKKNISNVNQIQKRLLTKALGRNPPVENKSD